MQSNRDFIRLGFVFGLIYFFSTNGLASLPGISVVFLLKEKIGLSASQASYFAAVSMLGWCIKPLWGIISDSIPICGYRRKPYLILTCLAAAFVWLWLGKTETYTAPLLLLMFTISSFTYAFNDVACDGLMLDKGKTTGLTGNFQSIQWGAVYVAVIITSLAGGWVADNWAQQNIFLLNSIFPLLVGLLVFFLITEDKSENIAGQARKSLSAVKETLRDKHLWLVAFFLFFWTFSPSAGTPFQYYSINVLKFDKIFFGIAGAVGGASAIFGAIIFAKFQKKIRQKKIINLAIFFGVVTTLFDLIYFTGLVQHNLWLARTIYLISAASLGSISLFIMLVLLNLSASVCPKYSEGTTFAILTSFWNIGLAGSSAVGGWLFDQIGLQPLIIVSALFSALSWLIVPYLKLEKGE
ncbi:MAG: MFS transporter [bacterium]|nr:MFS transporter [bacterium]